MRNKAVVLLSGGLDSATTLYLARKQGFKCFCLIFEYGQRHRREISGARQIAQKAGCPAQVLKISLPWKGSSLLDGRIRIPQGARPHRRKDSSSIPNTYVPARNIIFLSFALSYAEAIDAKAIFIGANALDYSGYPDCRPEFYRAFEKVISSGTKAGTDKKKIMVHLPLIKMGKAQIIKLGSQLGVPYELSWSCYQGGRRPCNRCDSCLFRAKGFREAGLKDPLTQNLH